MGKGGFEMGRAGAGGRSRSWLTALALAGSLLGWPVLAAPVEPGARVWDDGQVYREMGIVTRKIHGLRRVPETGLPQAAARAATEALAAWPQVRHALRTRGEEAEAERFEQALAELAAAGRSGDADRVRRALGRAGEELRRVQDVLRRPAVDAGRAARSLTAFVLLSAGFALLFARAASRRLTGAGLVPGEAVGA